MEVLQVPRDKCDAAVVVRVVSRLREGALIVYPTDTLYALGGLALDAVVAQRVRAAKRRDVDKPLPLIAGDWFQVQDLCGDLPPGARAFVARFWPGPVTFVLPAGPRLPDEITAGSGTVAVRIPDLELARALCQGAGPLISTSANAAGKSPPVTCADAVQAVGGAVELALDAGPGRSEPSTIVDVCGGSPRLIRAGAVPWEAIVSAWNPRAS